MQVDLSNSFETAEEAFKYMLNNTRSVELHNISSNDLHKELSKLCLLVKKYNETIEDEDSQILLSYPYIYRGIKGCLGVICGAVMYGTFKDTADKLALFCGWNYTVLNDPTRRKPLSIKALTSLSVLGQML